MTWHRMVEQADSTSPQARSARNVASYAALAYGIGYMLVLIGLIALVVELIARTSRFEDLLSILGSLPSWFYVAIVFAAIALAFAFYFSYTVIKISRHASTEDLGLNSISPSVSAFAFMQIFIRICTLIVAVGVYAMYSSLLGGYGSLVWPATQNSLIVSISALIGGILLFIGFRIYSGIQKGTRLTGAILLVASVVLIYFVSMGSFRTPSSYGGLPSMESLPLSTGAPYPPSSGPLLSELRLESVALLIATICGIVYALPTSAEARKQSFINIMIAVSVILFSIGLVYFNFSTINFFLSWSQVTSVFGSVWIIFVGLLLTGMSGVIALIAACMFLIAYGKQSSVISAPQAPSEQPPPPSSEQPSA